MFRRKNYNLIADGKKENCNQKNTNGNNNSETEKNLSLHIRTFFITSQINFTQEKFPYYGSFETSPPCDKNSSCTPKGN